MSTTVTNGVQPERPYEQRAEAVELDPRDASTALKSATTRVIARFEISGIVQGVGFRPFVHRLATEIGLDGHVGNDSTQVFVEVAGPAAAVDELARRMIAESPPLARIQSIRRVSATGAPMPGFRIVPSVAAGGARTLVSPDTAVCGDCLAELFDPADRRFRHPFITCTNCGPRFTIIRSLPYDRPNTTMAGFPMCAACRREYDDPTNRRYHAQPVSCHDCGPQLAWRGDAPLAAAPIDAAAAALRAGQIVAVKGLGGYHLACLATDEPLATLRARKHRPDKPFAVMVRDLAAARRVAHVDDAEASQLVSPERPIVLLRARGGNGLAAGVAPGNPLIGVMLAYTPVHHLLFDALDAVDTIDAVDALDALVMTSANLGGEPITYRDHEVDQRIGGLVDGVLSHDRPIHVPCDDSVVRVLGDRLLPVRRARGYAPIPVRFPDGGRAVLAVGGELKNTFCVASHGHAWVSQHVGDMENLATLDAFEASVAQFESIYAVTPEVVAADAHPAYLSSQWARRNNYGRVVDVQHHHAHIAAVMAEHGLDPAERVIGFAFDGTGYGDDGAIWGGELLVANATESRRAAHLAYVPLPGGDAAIRHPSRVALAHLWAAGVDWSGELPPVAHVAAPERRNLARQLESGFACVPTSSMGRLFDAVASLLDLRHEISYEAQAAIDLEVCAGDAIDSPTVPTYRFGIDRDVIEPAPVWRSIVTDLASMHVSEIALGFHRAVAMLVRELATRTRDELGLQRVALSGGCFQNALLTRLCVDALVADGFDTYTHSTVPPNDGGLSLGQAYIASALADPP